MTLTGIKFIIRGAEEKEYQKKVTVDGKETTQTKTYKRCKIQYSPYDTPFMIGVDRLVEDGVYLCGLKCEHDFDHNRDYLSLIVGEKVNA